jgi:hypothetical protein
MALIPRSDFKLLEPTRAFSVHPEADVNTENAVAPVISRDGEKRKRVFQLRQPRCRRFQPIR